MRTGDGVSVWYEEVPAPPEPTTEAMVDQGRRLSRLAERFTLLPMRWGTAVESLDDLDDLIREQARRWKRRLGAVEGRCELIIHVDISDDEPPARGSSTGREHLLRRVESLRHRDDVIADLMSVVERSSAEVTRLSDDRWAALVARSDVGDLTESVAAWAASHSDVHVAVTGPWPPFSFCDEEGSDA